ncbi:MAG TPA: HAD-IIIC family phosphatase [Vicinamibacterales bacterium]
MSQVQSLPGVPAPMTFLEAHRFLASFKGGTPASLLVAMSGTALQLEMFVRASAARRGIDATVRTLPFNTIAQTLAGMPPEAEREVFLLCPWDFVPELDWRSGIPSTPSSPQALRERAEVMAGRVRARRGPGVLYLPAPVPPIFAHPDEIASLDHWLTSLALSLNARLLPRDAFSLGGFLVTGCPLTSRSLGALADEVVDVAFHVPAPRKVLITDLDNVMWAGGIAEEGLDGIACGPDGKGFRHHVYQRFLKKLRHEGTLLGVVSRNDPDVAAGPFKAGRTCLDESSFVGFIASYHAKSAQIRELASRLNLGLDSFVFVDDNPIELAEVSSAIPSVHCVPFPDRDDAMPAFLSELQHLFARTVVTAEDRERTEMYRRRAENVVASDLAGADLGAFLRELEMSLTIHDRSGGDRTRAVQLINKTNQFNLNGHRITDHDIAAALNTGGRLFSASLSDRSGSHGEILSCLIDANGIITSFVMSCRVFQRRIEYAFLAWLATQPNPPVGMTWTATQRNEPFAMFVSELLGAPAGDDRLISLNAAILRDRFAADLELFTVSA